MKLRIGHLSTFYHTSILLQAQGRVGERLGAEVEWQLRGTGPAIMKAFGQGELDMAYIGLPPAIIGISRGIDVRCIAGGHMEGTVMAGKAKWLGIPVARDVTEVLQQFRGRSIGVPGTGSIHDVILRDCIAQHGLEGEIGIVNFPWADLVTEAVARDEVAAAVGTPALAVAIKRFTGGRVLCPAQSLWPDNPSYGIIADAGFIRRERTRVEDFLRLHEEAASLIRREPVSAARMIAGFVGVVDAEFILDTLMISPRYCAQLSEDFIASTMRFIPVLKKLGYLQSDLAQERIFSPELIQGVHPGADHYRERIGASDGR